MLLWVYLLDDYVYRPNVFTKLNILQSKKLHIDFFENFKGNVIKTQKMKFDRLKNAQYLKTMQCIIHYWTLSNIM